MLDSSRPSTQLCYELAELDHSFAAAGCAGTARFALSTLNPSTVDSAGGVFGSSGHGLARWLSRSQAQPGDRSGQISWGVFLILGRELAIAGWRVNQATISGANIWGKLKTVSQIVAIALLIAPLGPDWRLPALIAFWISVALTLISGAIYLRPGEKSA